MQYYRICFRSPESFFCFDEFQAESDEQALEEADLHVASGAQAEVWCGERKVAAIAKPPAPKPVPDG